jgi:hypothetical protein
VQRRSKPVPIQSSCGLFEIGTMLAAHSYRTFVCTAIGDMTMAT